MSVSRISRQRCQEISDTRHIAAPRHYSVERNMTHSVDKISRHYRYRQLCGVTYLGLYTYGCIKLLYPSSGPFLKPDKHCRNKSATLGLIVDIYTDTFSQSVTVDL